MNTQQWGDRIDALVANTPHLSTGCVLAECASTQDHARALGIGALVVAQRQSGGRGQRGNVWADTGQDGLAFSVCLPATTNPQRSADIAAAIVDALADLFPGRITVKHPNDVLLDDRKLAGVLIEQADGQAVIGIGINVAQTNWPPPLDETAISLAQAGIKLDRLDLLERVLPEVLRAWQAA